MEITRRQFVHVSAAAALGSAAFSSACTEKGEIFMFLSGLCLYVPENGMVSVGLVEPTMAHEQGRLTHLPVLMLPREYIESATAGLPEVADEYLPSGSERSLFRFFDLRGYKARFTSAANGLSVEEGELCPAKPNAARGSTKWHLPLIPQIRAAEPSAKLRTDWQSECWTVLELPSGDLVAPPSPRLEGVFKFQSRGGSTTHRQAITEWTVYRVPVGRLTIALTPFEGKNVPRDLPSGNIVVRAKEAFAAGAVMFSARTSQPPREGEYPGLPHFASFYRLFESRTIESQPTLQFDTKNECQMPQTDAARVAPLALLGRLQTMFKMLIDGSAACPPGTP